MNHGTRSTPPAPSPRTEFGVLHSKVGCWVKAPDGEKYHLVNEQSQWTVVVDCGRVFPASANVRSGGINVERCCKTCVRIGVRP